MVSRKKRHKIRRENLFLFRNTKEPEGSQTHEKTSASTKDADDILGGNKRSVDQNMLYLENGHQMDPVLENAQSYGIYRIKYNYDERKEVSGTEILFLSPSLNDILGVGALEELSFEKWFKHIHPQDIRRLEAALQNSLHPPFHFNETFLYNHPEKGRIWLEIKSGGEKDPQNPSRCELANGVILDVTARIEWAKRIQQSRERLRILLNNQVDVIWHMDLKLNFLYVSPSVFNLTGFTQEEWIGENLADHTSKNEFRKIARKALTVVRDYKNVSYLIFETSLLNKEKEEIPVEVSVKLYLNEQGIPVGTQGTIRDIRERKLADRKIRESEERLRKVIENMPVMMDAFDEKLNILVWNKECERVSGYKSSEFIGSPMPLEKIYPDPLYLAKVIKESKSGSFRNKEFRMRARDGEIKTISWSNISQENPIPGWDSWAIGVDITLRKNMEEKLRESEEKFKGIFEHANAGIAIADMDGKLLDANGEFCKIAGYSYAEVMRMNFQDFTYPEDFPREMELFTNVLEGKISSYRLDKRFLTREGKLKWVDISVTYRRNQDTGEGMFIGMALDMNERIEVQKSLKISEERLRLALDSADEGMWEWNLKSRGYFLDKGARKMLGLDETYSPLSEDFIFDLYHPDEREQIMTAARDYIRNKRKNFNIDFRMRKKDGEYIWIGSIGKITQWDEKGNPELFTGIHRNITEKKKTDKELEDYRNHLEVLIQERTRELEEKNSFLERLNKAMVDREYRLKELRDELASYKKGEGK